MEEIPPEARRGRWYIWRPSIPGETDLANHMLRAASLSVKPRTREPARGSDGAHGRGGAR